MHLRSLFPSRLHKPHLLEANTHPLRKMLSPKRVGSLSFTFYLWADVFFFLLQGKLFVLLLCFLRGHGERLLFNPFASSLKEEAYV